MKDVATLKAQIDNDGAIIDSHNQDITNKVKDINDQIDIINSQNQYSCKYGKWQY